VQQYGAGAGAGAAGLSGLLNPGMLLLPANVVWWMFTAWPLLSASISTC